VAAGAFGHVVNSLRRMCTHPDLQMPVLMCWGPLQGEAMLMQNHEVQNSLERATLFMQQGHVRFCLRLCSVP
jgi:hypothetical protein